MSKLTLQRHSGRVFVCIADSVYTELSNYILPRAIGGSVTEWTIRYSHCRSPFFTDEDRVLGDKAVTEQLVLLNLTERVLA